MAVPHELAGSWGSDIILHEEERDRAAPGGQEGRRARGRGAGCGVRGAGRGARW